VVALVVLAFRLPRVRTGRPAPPPLDDENLAEAGIPDLRAPGALLTYSWHAFALGIAWFGVQRVGRETDAPRTPWEVRFP
jgi:hypothetical protein